MSSTAIASGISERSPSYLSESWLVMSYIVILLAIVPIAVYLILTQPVGLLFFALVGAYLPLPVEELATPAEKYNKL